MLEAIFFVMLQKKKVYSLVANCLIYFFVTMHAVFHYPVAELRDSEANML